MDPCAPWEPAAVDPAGSHRYYVVNQIFLASTAIEARDFGLNLDGDDQDRPDNALGQITSIISGQLDGLDLNAEIQLLVDAGEMLHLLDVQAVSLADAAGVGVTVRHALDTDGDPTDNFSGDELFAIDQTRGEGTITGVIEDGMLRMELGSAPFAVTFPGLGEPFLLQLSMARIEATVTPTGIEGILAGGLSETEVTEQVVPILHEGLSRMIARDCVDGLCEPESFGDLLLRVFDEDENGELSLDEFRNNSLADSLLAPDVDLLDDEGRFAPRCDGVKEHLSVGLRFTAVPARIES